MVKQVEVRKADGSVMTPTFHKRARQLVKTGRAKWIGDEAICLLEEVEDQEETDMEIMTNDSRRAKLEGEFNESGYVVTEEPVDEKLYKMAKKRVQDRLGLITHVVAYLSVNLFLITISRGGYWPIYVIGGWGIGLVCHIVEYFCSATPQAIHKEYMKIKDKHFN